MALNIRVTTTTHTTDQTMIIMKNQRKNTTYNNGTIEKCIVKKERDEQ